MQVNVPVASATPITVYVAPDGSDVFVFPAIFVNTAEIALRQTGGRGIGADKPLLVGSNVRSLNGSDSARVTIRAVELMLGSAEENAVAAAVTNNPLPATHNKTRAIPELPDTLWTAELQVLRDRSSEWMNVGGHYAFERGQINNHVMHFTLSANDPAWRVLDRAEVAHLRLRIQGVYTARFTEPTLTATVSFLEARADSVLSMLVSKSGGKDPDFLIPIGGDAHSRFDLRQSLTRAFNIEINRWNGAVPNPADEAFLAKFLEQATTQVSTQANVAAASSDAILKFMLSSGLGLSAAKGNVTNAVNKLKALREDQLHTLFEAASQHHTVSGSDFDFGIDAVIEDLPIGISFGSSDSYENLDANQQKQVHDEFHRNLDEIEKQVAGNFVSVAAMNVNDIRNIVSSTNLKNTFAANKVSTGSATMVQSLSFPSVVAEGGSDQQRFVRLFDAAKQGFASIADELTEDIEATMIPAVGEDLRLQLNRRPPSVEFAIRRTLNAYVVAKGLATALSKGPGWAISENGNASFSDPTYRAQYGGDGGPSVQIFRSSLGTVRIRVVAPQTGWIPDVRTTLSGGWMVNASSYYLYLELDLHEATNGAITGSGRARHFGYPATMTVTGRRAGSLVQLDLAVDAAPGIASAVLQYRAQFKAGYPMDGTLAGLTGSNGPLPLLLFRAPQ
jgi:hypothetical protein